MSVNQPREIASSELEAVNLGLTALISIREVQFVSGPTISKEELRRSVVRSVRASARLENRSIPDDFVRSERVERFLAERRKRRKRR